MCWCVSKSMYVCEWCTLLHYTVLARTLPKFYGGNAYVMLLALAMQLVGLRVRCSQN